MKNKIKNIINNLNKDKIIKILITALFIFLPIIDMLRTTIIEDIEMFGISIIELLNFLLIGISFILTIPKIKKKHKKYLSIYFILIFIYGIFHIINTYKFNLSLVPDATHNFIVEAYYIIRVYILPLLLMIILFENKKMFNRKYYLNIVFQTKSFLLVCIILLEKRSSKYLSVKFTEECSHLSDARKYFSMKRSSK